MPRQQFVELACWVIGDAGKHIGEPGLRVDIVGPRGLDQGLEDDCAVTTAIGAAEQLGPAAERHTVERSFGGLVREADPAVFEEAGEWLPAAQHGLFAP